MKLSRVIFILIVAISLTIALSFGVSYSWYAYSNAESNINASTKEGEPTKMFVDSDSINTSQTIPILDSDRYNYANKNSFTITLDENLREYETAIEISLKDIAMDNDLKIENYKYELLQDGGLVANGNFKNIGSATTLTILPMSLLTPTNYPQTYTYELYIWLSETGENQNNLMNKGFSARIEITSASKK